MLDYLPIAAFIEKRIFCVHRGKSPFILTIDQTRLIDRKKEIPAYGAVCDLIWSEPDEGIDTWLKKSQDAGYYFRWMLADMFNRTNGLKLICRGHQPNLERYKYWFEGHKKNEITVWPSPKYCHMNEIESLIIKIKENMEKEFKTFKQDEKCKNSTHFKKIFPYFL